jgi:nifR3 family TIM-barrel protein
MFGNEKTLSLLKMDESERPIAQQIFGSDVESFVIAAKRIEELMHPDIIDINMGCPVPKIAVRSQAGSALLKNPEKIGEIVRAVVETVRVPVTVKIRSGWDENNINCVEVAKIIEASGASAITLHARTRSQGYSGKADWSLIKQVKEAVNIPVFANGDCRSREDYLKIMEITKADGVMIGRAAVGNPEIFAQVLGEKVKPNKLAQIKEHYETLMKYFPEKYVVKSLRAHLAGYLSGEYKNSKLLVELLKIEKYDEIIAKLGNFLA